MANKKTTSKEIIKDANKTKIKKYENKKQTKKNNKKNKNIKIKELKNTKAQKAKLEDTHNYIINRYNYNVLILFIFTFFTEMIVRYFSGAKMLDYGTLRIIISSIIISAIFSYIGSFFQKIGRKIINIIYVLFVGIYCFAEFGLSNFIGFFMGIGNAEQGTKVTSYIMDFLKALKPEHWLILLPLILILIYIIIFDNKVIYNIKPLRINNKKKKVIIRILPIFVIVFLIIIHRVTINSEIFTNKLQNQSNKTLWLYPENSNLSVNNFGVLMYGYTDILSNIKGIDADYIMNLEAKENEKNSSNKKSRENESSELERIIDDSAWDELISNTDNSTYNTLNNYFKNREITEKNEMTGKFEGKNLIVILMESVNEISIMNQEYFPTLYKMYHEGISFTNNFSPRNCCSTGNNEFTVLSSLFTINNTCTANAYATNKYFEGAFNMFNNAGYYTSAYHDYTQKYYKRATILPNLGANKYYGVTDLGIPYNEAYEEWPSDVEFFQKAQTHYMNEDKFMTYMAGVTTHQTYNVPSEMGDKYKDYFKELGYSTTLSRYLSKMKVLDEALAELLKELKESGKLENTVIALFGDHFPYGLTDSQINEYLKANNSSYTVNRNSVSNKNVDRTPLVIYNSGMEPISVNQYTSIIDLLPTLLNLFNIDYDPRLYLGTDIFSKSHVSRTVFADGSWTDEKGYYHAPNSKMNYNDGVEEYTDTEIQEINKEISTRQKMSASAIKSNYFNYLGKGLEKYKKVEETTSITEETTTSIVNN